MSILGNTEYIDDNASISHYISLIMSNMKSWSTNLEKTKTGMKSSFGATENALQEKRKLCIKDSSGTTSNKVYTIFNTSRYNEFIVGDMVTLRSVIDIFLNSEFTSIESYDKAQKKVEKVLDDSIDSLDRIKSDKIDIRLSYILDEFEDISSAIEKIVSYKKATKKENIFYIIQDFEKSLLSLSYLLNEKKNDDDRNLEEISILQMQIKNGKRFVREFVQITKSTAGYAYGKIVSFVND